MLILLVVSICLRDPGDINYAPTIFLTILCLSQHQVAPKGLLIVQQEDITLMVSKYLQDLEYMYLYQYVDNTERKADYETVVMNVDE